MGKAWLSRLFELTATLNRILTNVKTESTSHPNRVLSCRREFRRMSGKPKTNNESIQTGLAQVRTGSILDNSAAYRKFENERMKKQRMTITVRIPVRFGIHRSIYFMTPHDPDPRPLYLTHAFAPWEEEMQSNAHETGHIP